MIKNISINFNQKILEKREILNIDFNKSGPLTGSSTTLVGIMHVDSKIIFKIKISDLNYMEKVKSNRNNSQIPFNQ